MSRRPRDRLDPHLRDYVEGVLSEGLDAIHAAVAGDETTLRRITARAADPGLLAFVLARMAGHALGLTDRTNALLVDLAEHVDNPDHHHQGENS